MKIIPGITREVSNKNTYQFIIKSSEYNEIRISQKMPKYII